jgi:hypothetical protein
MMPLCKVGNKCRSILVPDFMKILSVVFEMCDVYRQMYGQLLYHALVRSANAFRNEG